MPRNARKLVIWLGLAILGVLALGVVGTFDMQAEQEEADLYCQMVEEGAWPDYKGTYERDCR